MVQTICLFPGVRLHCVQERRFKKACLSIQFLRPMTEREAPVNALIPAVLLRGSQQYPDLRRITWKLDDLYGASISALVRRIGDYQTLGLYCSFMEDRFALDGDRILEPMLALVEELLLHPLTESEGFCADFVQSEKRNLISTIESEINDKASYAMGRLLRTMCKADTFGVPRLGTVEQAEKIDPVSAYDHYRKVLAQSPVELFYVGSAAPEQVAALLKPIFAQIERQAITLPRQSGFCDAGEVHSEEKMDVAQAKLCLGYVTSITNRTEQFAAMQMLNVVFGSGMTSKLFMNIREKMSLCYSIGSTYYSGKGIVTVSAGIDADKEDLVRQQVAQQLENCCRGDITDEEFAGAKAAMRSDLLGIHDSPGSMETYYGSMLINDLRLDPARHMELVEKVTKEDVVAAAQSLRLHSSFVLKGVGA